VGSAGALGLVGRSGHDMDVVAGAAPGQADVEPLPAGAWTGDDVGCVDGTALGGVNGARIAEGQVGRDIVTRQSE
jgi:hypothetical protein